MIRTGARAPGPLRRVTIGLLAWCTVTVLIGVLVSGLALPGAALVKGVTATAATTLDTPVDPNDVNVVLPQRSVILAADGSTLASFWSQDRQVVASSDIAPAMGQAVVAIEDIRFYEHGPLDGQSVLRALVADATSGGLALQGGSTLTQQYAKNLMQQAALDRGDTAEAQAATAKTSTRKLSELTLAVHLEQTMTKDQILTGYLNTIYFGEGAYGVQSAAQRYFGVTAKELTLPQAATLAGLAQSPTDNDPYSHPAQAIQRRAVVLQRMVDSGAITAAQAGAAGATPLELRSGTPTNGCAQSSEPYFCDWVLGRLADLPALGATPQARQQALHLGGLIVRTTLQPATQAAAQAQAAGHIPADDPSGIRDAVAVVQPGTGAVLAMAQDSAYGTGPGQTMVNYAVDQAEGGSSGFQVGSTFKAFTLAAAFTEGIPLDSTVDAPPSGSAWTAAQFRSCQPVDVRGWHPTNVPGDPSGPMGLTEATAKSVNTAFIALEAKVGLCQVRDTAVALGVHSAMPGVSLEPVPSLTLGPYPVSPLTMAASYAAFAADGRYCQPTPFVSVTRDGQPVAVPGPQCSQAISPDVARTVTQALEAVITEGTGTMAAIDRPAAGKTGTTDNHAATWFAGYTPSVAAAVWVGNPDGNGHPMTDVVVNGRRYAPVNGGSIAAPIWQRVMSTAVEALPVADFAAPSG